MVGDFNDWDETANPLAIVHEGVWAGVVAGLKDGDIYKYAVEGPDGEVRLKADPFAFHAENGLPPRRRCGISKATSGTTPNG